MTANLLESYGDIMIRLFKVFMSETALKAVCDVLMSGYIGEGKKVAEFENLKSRIVNITDPEYIKADKELQSLAATILGLSSEDVRSTLISIELSSSMMDELTQASREAIPAAMSLYLIHPQSFLTDGRFLGFPSHYFYTSIFLLVLFVGLCWMYCIRTDRRDARLGIKEV